jgi:hypothetical protein
MAKTKTQSKQPYEAPDAAMFSQAADAADAAQMQQSVPLTDLFKQLGGYVKAHPYASAGTGLNAAANVAGLFDNDKLLGQGAGAALGYFAPQLLGLALGKPVSVSPLMRANLAMGGGTLGSLFDNLRAKKEEEQEMMQQYGGGY